MNGLTERMRRELEALRGEGNERTLPRVIHEGRYVIGEEGRMLNLSSNDYLGLASGIRLQEEFLSSLTPADSPLSSSSSRLLTGNFSACAELEELLASMYGTESALVFSSGYHANAGILPAICDGETLILADKLVHASLIDGIRLSRARCVRYRHNDTDQLKRLVEENHARYRQVIIVTESIFSMDGDEAELPEIVTLKRKYDNLLLYLDEAHAFGVRGERGLGCAEQWGCVADIDLLVGTFGKAAASQGAFVACSRVMRDYLVNKARTLIFTTALPPLNLRWTRFVVERLPGYRRRRKRLDDACFTLWYALEDKGYDCPSSSHIIPIITGDSESAIRLAERLRRGGFYVLPVRPPTVPAGTSRVRISLTADVTQEDIARLISVL